MQTFLPYPSLLRASSYLDYRRLGKQRVESFQILVALEDEWALVERTRRTGKTDTPRGWRNHPAVRMWRGYSKALRLYYNSNIADWIARGYKNTMQMAPILEPMELVSLPLWLGEETLHASHRSNLLRKDPEFYGQYGWAEGPDLEYVWPV